MEQTQDSRGFPYQWCNLYPGKQYISVNNKWLYPCPPTAAPLPLPPDQEVIKVHRKHIARIVLEHDFSIVSKTGFGIRPPEAEAMKLVIQHTSVPVAKVVWADFTGSEIDNNPEYKGTIHMTTISGICLEGKWEGLGAKSKESICRQIWSLSCQWREIPRPLELDDTFQCAADGSPSRDPMLQDLNNPPLPLTNDAKLRARIYERYLHYGGRQYERTLPDVLPRSYRSVFTHGDIAARNIMVDDDNNVIGILDWEFAGWYPDYWEYAQIMKPSYHGDFQDWMGRTAPQAWDITGINAARKVLF
ncbi:kinase-like protein [Aspergillus cavernicola]|uniref:non-specific serine/threonine protein kinase n=1 Tax=Aspergillus cavernicola TaxID=176166 RepID=A0ABR4IR31_9EURO